MQDLFAQRILINVLERLIDIADRRSEFDSLSASDRLLERLRSGKTDGFQFSAGLLLGQIRNHVLETYGSDSEEAVYLSTIAERIPDRVEQLVEVLRDAKIKNNMQSQMKWMWSIGGLQDGRERLPYSLLAGTVKHRQSWRYQPSDSLLSAMLAVCMVDLKTVSGTSGTAVKSLPRRSLPLSEVLQRLEFQFGVLINKVPDGFDTPENRVAAEENFRAFKNRLKQLGCFNGLSDDSLSQPVFNPKVSGNVR